MVADATSEYGHYVPDRVIRRAGILLARHLGIAENGPARIAANDPKGEETEIGWLMAKLRFILDPKADDPHQWPWIRDGMVTTARHIASNTIASLPAVARNDVPEEVFARIVGDDGGDLSELLQPQPA